MNNFIMCLVIALFSSCIGNEHMDKKPNIVNYLHLSHTRTNDYSKIDKVVEHLDYSKYEMLMLGGDLLYLTSDDIKYMNYADSIFDLSNKNTLWSVGHHDYTNIELLKKYTKRPLYYTYHKNGITFIVLDTRANFSSIDGEQIELFTSVTDTIEQSSHLVLLHHKLIWMYSDPVLEPQIPDVSNGGLGDCFYCINPNNFYTDVYPQLVEVKNRNIEVLCIGGDLGLQTNEFEYLTPEGIQFLASGIKWNESSNKALLFNHDIDNQSLDWKYKLLSDL